jgi:hypothetical protein
MVSEPTTDATQVSANIAGLHACILPNNMKPELQCIYMDATGAVTCDTISACINPNIKHADPILMLPDIQAMLQGKPFTVKASDDLLHLAGDKVAIQIMSPAEKGDDWPSLRQLAETPTSPVPKGAMEESLKRLAQFGELAKFRDSRIYVGTNYEPFTADWDSGNVEFKIAAIQKLLPFGQTIALAGTNIHIYAADGAQYIVSGEEALE